MNSYKLTVIVRFESAHQIKGYDGKCANLHGHNYKAEIEVTSHQLNELGLAVDSVVIKKQAKKIVAKLDHQNLNELDMFQGINPTAETIAEYLYHELAQALDDDIVKVSAVTLWETDDFFVRFEPG